MSSSQPFICSSPLSSFSGSTNRRKSKFTYKHLSQLGTSSTTCPLRVIAHIDLDAFYAQCEMVRLNVPEDQPLAVQVSARPIPSGGRSDGKHVAMARPYSNQLSRKELWLDSTYHHYRSQEALSEFDYATCRDVEGRGREMGVP